MFSNGCDGTLKNMQDTDRTLYVLCGIPYSGKSTFADKDPVLSGLPKLSSDRLILEKANA